ncbi:MAG: nucleoside diphosphate kinase regulator [Parasphingorhabdus sp.]
MNMKTPEKSAAPRPVIHMIDEEGDAIEALAMTMEAKNPKVAELLYEELARAQFHSAETIPADIVTMNSKVEFIDERSGSRRVLELVYPRDADIEKGRISIFTPTGAGLIGMVAGETISWPDRSGAERILRIVSVTPPETAEAAAG